MDSSPLKNLGRALAELQGDVFLKDSKFMSLNKTKLQALVSCVSQGAGKKSSPGGQGGGRGGEKHPCFEGPGSRRPEPQPGWGRGQSESVQDALKGL